jgi:hypothetical protein
MCGVPSGIEWRTPAARGRGRVCDIALLLLILIVAALAALVLLAALSGLLALLSGLVLLTALLPAALARLLGLLSRLLLLSGLVGILIHDISCGCTPGEQLMACHAVPRFAASMRIYLASRRL